MSTMRKVIGGGRGDKGKQVNNDRTEIKQEKFEGRAEGLAGYVFNTTTARNANNYTQTLKEIARHVGSSSKFGADLRRTIEDSTMFTVIRPTRPATLGTGATADKKDAYNVGMDIYRKDIKNFVKRRSTLEYNMGRAFEIIWGQCTQAMRAKVEAMPTYKTISNSSDLLGLLRLIKHARFDFHSLKNPFQSLIKVEKAFKNFRQDREMNLDKYHEKFRHLAEAYESCGGCIK